MFGRGESAVTGNPALGQQLSDLSFEFRCADLTVLHFVFYRWSGGYFLECLKLLKDPVTATARDLRGWMVRQGLITFHDERYYRTYGSNAKENFRQSVVTDRGGRHYWRMIMQVLDRKGNLFLSCHVPLSRITHAEYQPYHERLTPRPIPHRDPLKESFLLTAIEQEGCRGRTGYKLVLIPNKSKFFFGEIWFHFETVEADRGQKSKLRYAKLISNYERRYPGLKEAVVNQAFLPVSRDFYYGEQFNLPRKLVLVLKRGPWEKHLTYWLPAHFPHGCYASHAPFRTGPGPIALPCREEKSPDYFIRYDDTPLSDRGKVLQSIEADRIGLDESAKKIRRKLLFLEQKIKTSRESNDIKRHFDRNYQRHFQIVSALIKPILNLALSDPAVSLKGMQDLNTASLKSLIPCLTRVARISAISEKDSLYGQIEEIILKEILQMNTDRSQIVQARLFAKKAHRDQKYGTKPYLYHLDMVARILSRYEDPRLQVIGYLHDVLEDTDITLGELEAKFGNYIAHAVYLVSDEPGRSRKERKKKTNYKLRGIDEPYLPAVIVKTADRLANLKTSVENGPEEKLIQYREEMREFRKAVYRPELCEDLWEEIESVTP